MASMESIRVALIGGTITPAGWFLDGLNRDIV